jgi:hypothetical protein
MNKFVSVSSLFFAFLLFFLTPQVFPQVIDSFDDGDFTSNPTWSGTDSTWIIVTNSDVAVSANNSYTLRLNKLAAVADTQYLSTQRTASWGTSQSWSFWLGRRAQAASDPNHSIVWLWANESNLRSATVDGYRIRFGDNSGQAGFGTNDDEVIVQRVDNGVATNILISSGAVPNGLTDIGFRVRVTRTSGSVWTLYTDTLPTASGTGAVATDVPTAANTQVNQGSVTDATYTDFSNGYFGFMAIHSSGPDARKGAEFDQFFFEANSDAPLPIQLASYTASLLRDDEVEIEWKTVSEKNNYGFEVHRKRGDFGEWSTIAFVEGHGTTLAPHSYSYVDRAVPFGKYFYRIKQIDLDGKSETFPEMEVNVGVGPDKLVLAQNYPNPFNPSTVIEFAIPQSDFVSVRVYNLLGQEVANVFEGNVEGGRIYSARFEASTLPSGLYFYTLRTTTKTVTKRMVVMK